MRRHLHDSRRCVKLSHRKLHPDGTLDPDFRAGDTYIDSTVSCIALQADGHIFIGGDFLHVGGAQRFYLAGLGPDGTLDNTFNPGKSVNRDIYSIAVGTNGQVIIGGEFSAIGQTNINGIARLNSNGTLDTTFNVGSGNYSDVYKVALQQDGKILLAGTFTYINAVARNYIARLNADDTLDGNFNPNIVGGYVRAMALEPDGKSSRRRPDHGQRQRHESQ